MTLDCAEIALSGLFFASLRELILKNIGTAESIAAMPAVSDFIQRQLISIPSLFSCR